MAIYYRYKKYYGSGKVIPIPNMTFFATCEAVLNAGLIPYICDIKLNGQMIPNEYGVVVSLHGLPYQSEYSENFLVIEDNCQCGPNHFNKNCYASCYSLFPSKPIGTCADGGYIVTIHEDLANYCRLNRYHGIDFTKDRRMANLIGGTNRLTEISALFAIKKLEQYDNLQFNRLAKAYQYCEELNLKYNKNHYYHIFNVFVKDRNSLCEKLNNEDIEWSLHYNYSIEDQLRSCGYKDIMIADVPDSNWFKNHCLSLPLNSFLEHEEINKICNIVKPFLTKV